MDDDFLPDGAAEAVGEVVDLIHHHIAQVVKGCRVRVQHVPEDFRGHHDDGSVTVDACVAGEQPYIPGAVLLGKLSELLVAEGLDRSGVERLEPTLQGEVDGELPDDRFPGSRGGRHQHSPALLQGAAGLPLEVVELEVECADERSEVRRSFGPAFGAGLVPLCGGELFEVSASGRERSRGRRPGVGGHTPSLTGA